MVQISGKHAVAELLRQEGVEYIFGNPGTSELPLIDVLAQRNDIRYILSLHEGVALAMTPPTGPVFLALPMDVLEETADVDPSPATRPDLRLGPLPELLAQAAEILGASKNPTLLVGDRVAKSGALAEAVALAETLGARVYAEPQANTTAFPSEHPLFAGVLPGLSQGIRRAKAARCMPSRGYRPRPTTSCQ
jgi:thiamine pyrophosphate-dependent acetolactate synthase large subunit-like protein